MESAKGAIAVNQEAYDATMAMYRVGKVTSLDVMQAQVSLINSKASYVNYYATYQTALAQLRKVIGEGEKVYEK
jgi:outer membrane protein TolC